LSDIVKEKLSDIIAETGRTREDIIIKNNIIIINIR